MSYRPPVQRQWYHGCAKVPLSPLRGRMFNLVFKIVTLTAFAAVTLGQTTLTTGDLVYSIDGKFSVSQKDIERMKTATWLNAHQVAMAVNFTDTKADPYQATAAPFDVSIDPAANCYVVFRDREKTTYDMITALEPPTDADFPNERQYGVFLSHETPCGVCSNLWDLAVYLEKPDLTNPVRLCGFTSFVSGDINLECLKEGVGFSDDCAAIWFYNTQYTREKCMVPCILLLFAESNQPFGIVDPCRPASNGGTCENTINQGPACADFQYDFGSEYRLNACLQCDECNSGPLFQKIAGRTRRASGIESGIDRPDIPLINHNYFTSTATANWNAWKLNKKISAAVLSHQKLQRQSTKSSQRWPWK